jgi:CitB family two-component system response regulator MalR/two-component system response regulator DctR
VAELYSSGVSDYLIKPFDYNRFQSALKKFTSRRAAFGQDKAFSQEELDKVIAPEGHRPSQMVDKGIHPVTLEIICSFLREHRNEKLSIEDIAKNVSLSRVTLRRYMNYLIDKNSVIGGVDYTTGGRPSAVYTYIGK